MNNTSIDPCLRLAALAAERACLRALRESMGGRLKAAQTDAASAALAGRPPAWTPQEMADLGHELHEVERLLLANGTALDAVADELLPADC